MKKLSIISPLFNEEENIKEHYTEICDVVKNLNHFDSHEIIIVNDGSTDNSLKILKVLAQNNKNLKIISFTRNFGHEQATTAGLNLASGDALVILDADRQHPPTTILDFEKEFVKGFDIVYGKRVKRLKESFLRKITAKIFYPLFGFLTQVDIPQDISDFCMLSKKVINVFNSLPEKQRFVRGLIYWSGLSKKAVPFVCRSRQQGKSKYNYTKLTIFALENIVSFSSVPIYIIIFFSLFLILVCLTTSISTLIFKIDYFIKYSFTLVIFLLLSTILFSLGIIGLYIGKMFQEIKNRPSYLIDEKINF